MSEGKLTEELATQFASKRLLRDYVEIKRNPIANIAIEPLENNLFEWHCSMQGPPNTKLQDSIFHFVFIFPTVYPSHPPKITVCSHYPHAHVFEKVICLDILNTHYTAAELGTGWTSAYTVHSILLQLQSFLYDAEDLRQERMTKAIQEAKEFTCKCGHSHEHPFPKHIRQSVTKFESKTNSVTVFDRKIWEQLFLYLPFNQLQNTMQHVCKTLTEWIIQSRDFRNRKEICCFHTKMTAEEAVLGIGIYIQGNIQDKSCQVTSECDIVSYFSYSKEGLRNSMWKAPFHFWIPLYINHRHAKASLPFFEKSVNEIFGRKMFKEMDAVSLLCKLMNSMIVVIMKGSLHASLKALNGYLWMHRLLIFVVNTYPNTLIAINEQVKQYMEDPMSRRKDKTPSIGEFLPLLSVSDLKWPQLAIAVLQETLCRNILWTIGQYPEFGNTPKTSDILLTKRRRLKQFTQVSLVSMRLIMFHVYFLKHVTPSGKSLNQIAEEYDAHLGVADEVMQQKFQKAVFHIMKVKSFNEFFDECYVKLSHQQERQQESFFIEMMEDCWIRSYLYNYHKNSA